MASVMWLAPKRGPPRLPLPLIQKVDHAEERNRVQQKCDARSGSGNDQTAERRADGARYIESRRIQGHSGGKIPVRDRFGRDRLPRRIVQHRPDAHQQREHQSNVGVTLPASVSTPVRPPPAPSMSG